MGHLVSLVHMLVLGAPFRDPNEASDLSDELGQRIQAQGAQPFLGPLWELACPGKVHQLSSLWSSVLPVGEWVRSMLSQVSARQLL